MENDISQALTKPQDVTPPNPGMDSTTPGTNHASNFTKQTGPFPCKQIILGCNNTLTMRHITNIDLMKHLYIPMLM